MKGYPGVGEKGMPGTPGKIINQEGIKGDLGMNGTPGKNGVPGTPGRKGDRGLGGTIGTKASSLLKNSRFNF